jgi:hypothetical protein
LIQVKAQLKPIPPYATTDAENKIAPGTPITINIPHDLVNAAMCYPSLDWNDVMKQAVRIATKPCN